MRIGQNYWPLEKLTHFLFMHLNVACITNIWCNNTYADTNLCNHRLTRIIKLAQNHVALRYILTLYHTQ